MPSPRLHRFAPRDSLFAMHSTSLPPRSRWETAGVLAFVLMGLGLGFRLVVEQVRRGNLTRQNGWTDVFAPAAEAFLAGGPMYTEASGFRYPPLAAALMVPFTWLGELGGSIAWRWALLLGLFLGVRACLRAGFPCALSSRERGVFWLLLVPAVIGGANYGQPNTLVLGGMLWATLAACRRAHATAALGVLNGTTWKVYPFAHGLVLGVLRPRLVPWLLASLVVLLALPFVLQRPSYVWGQYRELFELLAHEDRTQDSGQAFRSYRDLRLVLRGFGAPITDRTFQLLQLAGGALLAAFVFWLQRRRRADAAVFEAALSLSVCWCLLLGPATERYTYALLGPSLAWPLLERLRAGIGPALPWLVVNGLYLVDHADPLAKLGGNATWTRCLLPMTTMLVAVLFVGRALRAPLAAEAAVEKRPGIA